MSILPTKLNQLEFYPMPIRCQISRCTYCRSQFTLAEIMAKKVLSRRICRYDRMSSNELSLTTKYLENYGGNDHRSDVDQRYPNN